MMNTENTALQMIAEAARCPDYGPDMVMAKRLPGRIRNATRTKPPLKSIWKAGKKPTPIYSRKFPRRYQNSMSTILPCMERSCRGTRWRVRNR